MAAKGTPTIVIKFLKRCLSFHTECDGKSTRVGKKKTWTYVPAE